MPLTKAVVITGGTGGLGSVVTRAFLASGWQALVTFLDEKGMAALKDGVGDLSTGLQGVRVDLTSADGLSKVASMARRSFGSVSALVNLAGGFTGGHAIEDTPEQDWDRMLELNAKTVFLACRALAPLLKASRGSIVTVGARAAVEPSPHLVPYAVSKAAVVALTRTLAEEMKSDGVRANCILPGTIDTPANRAAMPNSDFSRWVSPRQIAELILFLCEDRSKATSGAVIPVFGSS
ncbi:MAG: SDR family NAD(P)-dependent oxidoreductase [Armatimonadetes bacterium]|nr:SDR family NAD(P)-dependent oxidoreductase [Armatimonadota bacterium]